MPRLRAPPLHARLVVRLNDGRKPTPSSVTSTSCKCPWLRNAVSEAAVRVRFNEEAGEYQVEHRDGGYSVIRHCPWCGGAAPRSWRASLFAFISTAEVRRLERLITKVKTVEDALANFGEPDHREPQGLTIHTPGRGRRPVRIETFPTMTFTKLSKVADVTLADYSPKGVGFSFSPKHIGRRKGRGRASRRRP